MTRRNVNPDDLAALAKNAEDMHALEREYAEHALSSREDGVVLYCAGPGCVVVALHTQHEWERRAVLSARRCS